MGINPQALDELKNNQKQLDQDGNFVGVSRQALDELLAAWDRLSAVPASQAVAVRALEWEERSGAFYADTALGEAYLDQDGDGFYVIENGRKHSEFGSVADAKAFVQKNHAAWISDWLAPLIAQEPAEGVAVGPSASLLEPDAPASEGAAPDCAALLRENERLTAQLEEADKHAQKIEALLNPHVSWEGKPSAFEATKARARRMEEALTTVRQHYVTILGYDEKSIAVEYIDIALSDSPAPAETETQLGQKPGERAAQGSPADEQSGETSPAPAEPDRGGTWSDDGKVWEGKPEGAVRLTDKDAAAFVEAISNPPEPNAKLRELMADRTKPEGVVNAE